MAKRPSPRKTLKRKKGRVGAGQSRPVKRSPSGPVPAERDETAAKPDDPVQPAITHFIVGIGASAGGLEALTKLLENLPPDSGMSFVVVQHLDPSHGSMLTDLLSRATSMKVSEVRDGMLIEPNRVYVISPNTVMTVSERTLHLLPRAEHPLQPMPVDTFFRSLAGDQGQQAIGVILSGTGSDGTLGVRAIKAEGGLVFAQDERSAKYVGMPKSAVATGAVDFVLSPEKIASELVRISRHPFEAFPAVDKTGQLLPMGEGALNKIFLLIKSSRGVDFTLYKHTTILRRIHRRMLIHKTDSLPQYLRYLRENPSEVGVLFNEILINVTSFFREPETFLALKNVVFPRIVENKAPSTPIRVWVPACSTGEEAYSIAMCFAEFCEERGVSNPLQLFASDVDEEAIDRARQGVYPETIAQDVSPERLRRFFVKTGQGYQISKSRRELCVFARHDLIKDPPFSRMDLISCRNLLIYFGKALQEKALPILHYALQPSGFLMLGKSESVGDLSYLFSLVDKPGRIYSKKIASTEQRFAMARDDQRPAVAAPKEAATHFADRSDIRSEIDAVLLDRFGPSGLVVNKDLDILQFRGNIAPYLKPASGKASLNIMKMAANGLAIELRSLVREASRKYLPVRKAGVKVKRNGVVTTVTIEVIPVRTRESADPLFLVVFEEVSLPASAKSKGLGKIPASGKARAAADRIASLAGELAATQGQMRSIISEYEASAEELKALNEEVQSSNEELQSVNEELETSSEELQSTNEELNTVNDELRKRNEDVSQLNNDLKISMGRITEARNYAEAIVETVREPLIILDKDLRVITANRAYYRQFETAPEATEGLLFYELHNGLWDIPRLRELIEDILPKETVFNDFEAAYEVPGKGRRTLLLNARRVVSDAAGVHMILLAVEDITERRRAEEALAAAHQELERRAAELAATNKELEAFAYSVSHDLRSPLRHIEGFVRILLEEYSGVLDEKGKDYLRRVSSGSQKMKDLVDALLSLSRYTSANLSRSKVYLSAMVEAAVAERRQSWPERTVELVVAEEVTAEGDPTMLQVVINNLVWNSWKFTQNRPDARIEFGVMESRVSSPESRVDKTVSSSESQDSKAPSSEPETRNSKLETVYFIKDNGAGFDKKYRDKLFTPFLRLHSDDEFPGLGIGLSIVQRIIHRHGGRIWAEGEVDKGATFFFTLG